MFFFNVGFRKNKRIVKIYLYELDEFKDILIEIFFKIIAIILKN